MSSFRTFQAGQEEGMKLGSVGLGTLEAAQGFRVGPCFLVMPASSFSNEETHRQYKYEYLGNRDNVCMSREQL